jgi:hypothetical protein
MNSLQHDYSRGIKILTRFAPAATHNFSSFLMLPKTTEGGACLWRKILAFRSFQTSQEVRRTTEASALRLGVDVPVKRLHQS